MSTVSCKEVQRRLAQYVRGELEVEELARFRWHISDCSACQHEQVKEGRLQQITSNLFAPTSSGGATPEFIARVHAKIEQRQKLRRLYIFVLIIFTIVVAIYMWQQDFLGRRMFP